MKNETPKRETDWVERMRLTVITGSSRERGRDGLDVAKAALASGCRAIQLRDKSMEDRPMTEMALKIRELCDERGALFLVNDRVDVAAASGSDGVHLGVLDLEPRAARALLGPEAIIGFSPESPPEASWALRNGADYLGVGDVFGSTSKHDSGEPIGLDGLSRYIERGRVVVAVGGVNSSNAGRAIVAGAAGVAVLSAVVEAEDMERATEELIEAVGVTAPDTGGVERL